MRGWHNSSQQKEQGEKGKGTMALPAKWHVEELKNPHKKCLLNSLNPHELGDCRLAPVSPRGVDCNSLWLLLPNFLPLIFGRFWQTTWQGQTEWGRCFSEHTPNPTQTEPNQSMQGSAPAASVLICWLSACLICFCLCPKHNYATAQPPWKQFDGQKHVCSHFKRILILRDTVMTADFFEPTFQNLTPNNFWLKIKTTTSSWHSHCWWIGINSDVHKSYWNAFHWKKKIYFKYYIVRYKELQWR